MRTVEKAMRMKLACASGAFDREIESGELTQLEFLDLCARELDCDGVVLDVRHFPRTDDEYLAQIKKLCADWGLAIAALADARFFLSGRAQIAQTLRQATALGAPLVAAPLARETECSWSEQLERLSDGAALGKETNVTLALRNAAHTFAATAHDCKRAAKETDSAWLRFGPDPSALDAASDPRALAPNTVLLWSDASEQTEQAIAAVTNVFETFRGFVAIENAGPSGKTGLARTLALWRRVLCRRSEKELNHR